MKKEINKVYNVHKIWVESCNLCESEINDEIDINFDSGLNQVLIDILVEFYEYKYENNVLMTKDVLNNRNDLPQEDVDEEYGYYPATKENVQNDLSNFVHYYLLDDGKVSLFDDKLMNPSSVDEIDSYYDNNITQTGAAIWIVEQLGSSIYCDIVMTDENERDFYKLATVENFTEALEKFNEIIEEKDIDRKHCQLDYCLTGSVEKKVIIILPEINI